MTDRMAPQIGKRKKENWTTTFATPVTSTRITLDMLQEVTSIKHASGLILGGKKTSALAVDSWENYQKKSKILVILISKKKT